MSKKAQSEFIRNVKMAKPEVMDYYVPLNTDKDKHKFIKRVESIVRGSMEYRDYISFLKEHVDLDKCIFFQNVTNSKNSKKRISIELHHEPFTLYDIVRVVLEKAIKDGDVINDLIIADSVLKLHYENKVGLVPLSKTAHEIIHAENSSKLIVPLNMVYGNYSEFLEEYGDVIDDDDDLLYKLAKKMDMTANLTPESFDAIRMRFTYLDIEGVDDVEKLELDNKIEIA